MLKKKKLIKVILILILQAALGACATTTYHRNLDTYHSKTCKNRENPVSIALETILVDGVPLGIVIAGLLL